MANKQVRLHTDFAKMLTIIHEVVDKNFNCEDIGMNFVVAAALSQLNRSAPLFVKPLHLIGDFGKVGKGGLHQRQSHTSIRNTCLNRFNDEFRRVLGISLPKQHYVAVVVPNATGPSHSLVPYNGNRMRLHRDCKKVSTQFGDPCSWK